MTKLTNKVAVITGGNSGIGFATAKAFIAEGAQVLVVGRRADAVRDATAALGGQAVGLVGDVADLATHERVAALASERFGGVDIYVANAGVNRVQPSAEVTPDVYDMLFQTNARAAFFGVQTIAPMMREGGAVLLTSSIATRKTLDGHAVYAGSKAAIEAFARSWALEFKDRRIRVNILSPGPTETPIIRKLGVPADALPDFERQVAGAIPFGRMARDEDIARAALFLASADSSFVTGVTLTVDGGLMIA